MLAQTWLIQMFCRKLADLRQLIFSPEVSSHSCSLCIPLSIHVFPQLSIETADETQTHLTFLHRKANQDGIPVNALMASNITCTKPGLRAYSMFG